ncbi:MAG: archaeosortase/exosortase family protein, partial [Puniceicoccales bacterium]|nr:archaeosortase/exosortase family protein [Puniceicoccales bacterium]
GETLLFASGQAVRVTRECGGADFFSMVCALLAWQFVPCRARRIVLFPLAAWGVTMLVNAMRVIATVWTRTLGGALLPERLEAATHLLTGVLVFFPSLLAVWLISKRLARRER